MSLIIKTPARVAVALDNETYTKYLQVSQGEIIRRIIKFYQNYQEFKNYNKKD